MASRDDEQQRASRLNDSSTDSIEIALLRDSGRTHSYQPTIAHGAREASAPSEIEANVILIAHPENRLLGSRFRLRPGSMIEIGRSPAAEISLTDVLSVSRNHARLEHHGSRVMIQDLGSTNGTYVNDKLVQQEQALASGDRFQVGAVHFKFLHERDVENAYHLAISDLVMRDGLTEIFNKRKYEEEVQREVARAVRYDRPLTLVLLDIDHFKAINDNYGHLCGDFVLKQVSDRVREVLRPEQTFARVGGEEFVVLCPETSSDQGAVLAEKLRQRIAAEPVEYAGFEVFLTCSFGVAQLHSRMMADAGGLYLAADRALYDSKQAGRNTVTVHSPLSASDGVG
ncbi:MAG TPA: GGDEF domain-containing protein [Thermoanaerobaculia bacterium]|nr:GGDEF domain-containing protein [Thermoanaerobaculia bacterium]